MYDDEDYNNPFAIRPRYPMLNNSLMRIDPLSSLSNVDPEATSSLIRREQDMQLDIIKRATEARVSIARYNTMSSISNNHKDIACSWINNRQSWETRIEIQSTGGVQERGWFAEGENGSWKTTVKIS